MTPYPFFRHLISVLFIALPAFSSQAQTQFSFTYNNTVYTYYGQPLNDTSNPYWQYISAHPASGVFMAGPTDGHYNCHAFAWPNVKSVWVETSGLSTDAPQIYYNSGYYVETTEDDAEIAVYGNQVNPIHSAVRITNSANNFGAQALNNYRQYAGWYISKWDGGPVVVHRLDSCPYYLGSLPPHFYRRWNTGLTTNHISGSNYAITGPSVVCASGSSFSLNCPAPVSFTVTWSGSANITFPTGSAYPLNAVANGNGPGYVQATLHFPDGTSDTVLRYPVKVGTPDNIGSVSTSQWQAGPGYYQTIVVGTSAEFYAWPFTTGDLNAPHPVDLHGATNYTWSSSSLTFYQNPATANSRYVAGSFAAPGYGYISVQASNACGSSNYMQSIRVSTTGQSYKLTPNPATDQVKVNILAPELAQPEGSASGSRPVSYIVRIIDLSGAVCYTAKQTGTEFSIPVRSLRTGTYVMEISNGKTIATRMLFVQH